MPTAARSSLGTNVCGSEVTETLNTLAEITSSKLLSANGRNPRQALVLFSILNVIAAKDCYYFDDRVDQQGGSFLHVGTECIHSTISLMKFLEKVTITSSSSLSFTHTR